MPKAAPRAHYPSAPAARACMSDELRRTPWAMRHAATRVSAAVLCVMLASPSIASAAQGYLSCQAGLHKPDCTEVTSTWPASQPLHIGASCQECSGGGSDISCSPGELVTPTSLSLQTAAGVEVGGSFSAAGSCGFGLTLFRYDTALAGSTAYQVVLTLPEHDKTLLLSFSTDGGAPAADGGGAVTRDGGVSPSADGSLATVDDGGAAGDSGSTGEAGVGPSPSADDGGCGCGVHAARTPSLLVMLGLVVLVGMSRRRRGNAH